MIKVVITLDEQKEINSIEVKGHANSDEHGKDLVCASVSAVITGGMNAIKDKQNFSLILDRGYSLIDVDGPVSEYDRVVLKTIETQLRTIEETNSKFIDIKTN